MLQNIKNKTIGILCGGVSDERAVSLNSGKNVYRILQEAGYKTVLLELVEKKDVLSLIQNSKVDIIFNLLHGYFGEDGQVQSILDYYQIPYTGSSREASLISMDKFLTKLIAKDLGVKVPKGLLISKNHLRNIEDVPFNFPWFIKPRYGGSSIETYLVKNKDDYQKIQFNPDLQYLLEEMIEGQEVTAGILQENDTILNLPILGFTTKNEFYDYEAKYTQGMTNFILPAPISQIAEKAIYKVALQIHEILGCDGASRSDFIVKQDEIYFLEINSNPGMTVLSDIPAEAQFLGMSEIELCESILFSAIKRMPVG